MTDSHDNAKKYAFKLLSYRGRSEKELKERLVKKGISKTVASATVHHLKDLGLIDDRSLAESLKREALTIKLLGQKGAIKYLLHRGIPRDIIKRVLSNNENIDIFNARLLINKKVRTLNNYSPLQIKRKLYGFLVRRGYSIEIINKVLKEKYFHEEDL